MRTTKLIGSFLLIALLSGTLAAEESTDTTDCDAQYDICSDKCDTLKKWKEKCYDKCEAISDECMAKQEKKAKKS